MKGCLSIETDRCGWDGRCLSFIVVNLGGCGDYINVNAFICS